MPTRLLLAIFLFLTLVWPAKSQGPIYLPIIEASMIKPLKSTIAITIPRQDQNYVLNPSAETTGNFAALAGTTVTRVTTYQKYGLYSYEVNSNADNEGMTLTLLAYPNAQAFVTVRARGQLPPAWDTSLDNTNYHELRLLERIDANWNLYGAMIPASQASGSTTLYIRQNGAGSGLFYLDGVQVSSVVDGRYPTTYIDGTQEGCSWLGAPNASASIRSGDSRAGGVVTSFWEGFNFFPEKALGMGTTPEELNIDSYAFLPGGELNSSKIPPREFTIIGYFLANDVESLHEHAQRLELELSLNTYPAQQPIRLRYSGARVLKEISANYVGGLEGDLPIYYNDDWSQEDESWVRNYKFKMRASIQFVALDPFWYEVGESATLLDTNDTAIFRVMAARFQSTGQWSPLGPPGAGGTYTSIKAIVEDDIYVYIGGDFVNFDGIAAADYIVRYNKQTGAYSAMSNGLTGPVFSMALAPDGTLYIGGNFINVNGTVGHQFLTTWDGSAFVDPSGTNNIVLAVTFGPDGTLYIGGQFTIADIGGASIAANRIAARSPSGTWSTLGTGFNSDVNSLVTSLDGTLYAGGNFTTASGNPAVYIVKWENSAWVAMSVGNGEINDTVMGLAIGPGNILYAVGFFDSSDNSGFEYAAMHNGSIWLPMGAGLNDNAYDVAVGPDGMVYVSGEFTQAGDLNLADNIARFNGYTWSHLDIDLPGTAIVNTILPSKYVNPIVPEKYNLYLGFDTTGTGAFAGLTTPTNEGTISAFPQIVFSRSGGTTATIQTLRNERTGRELLFNYSLLNGESLVIDLNPKARMITSSFFGPRMDAILANSDFSTWQLLPGNNDVTSFVSESGSPTVTSWMIWREPYRGWN